MRLSQVLVSDETRISPISFQNEKPVRADQPNMRNRHSYADSAVSTHVQLHVTGLLVMARNGCVMSVLHYSCWILSIDTDRSQHVSVVARVYSW
jgi:hypothetical protein